MATFTLRTGNLSKAIAATARTFGKVEETKEWKASSETARLCLIRYKLSKKDKEADKKADGKAEFPASFAIEVPVISYDEVAIADKGEAFLNALVEEYQDSVLKDVADKESAINPCDIQTLVNDYFDSTRQRKTPKLATIKEWAKETWALAYMQRVEQRNATPGTKVQDDKQTAFVIERYSEMMLQLARPKAVMARQQMRDIQANIEKLLEVKLLEDDDEIAAFLVERIGEHIAEYDKANSQYVSAEV